MNLNQYKKNFLHEGKTGITNFVINSKEVKKGSVFIAVKGKKTDGHFYIQDAIQKRCRFVVVKKNFKSTRKNKKYLIKVPSTLKFLENVAIWKRNQSKNIFIGVTGSFGKTTLKSMLQFFLQKYKKTYSSPKSFNNHFGLPLSLSNVPNNSIFNIFELGMSKKGEIEKLAKILKPNIGVITNIGPAHIGNFKNLRQICLAKAEIINHIHKQGVVLLNRDDQYFITLAKIAKEKNLKIISFGTSNKSNVRLLKIITKNNNKYLLIQINQKIFKVKTLTLNDSFNKNFLIVVAILNYLKLDIKKIIKIAKNFIIPSGRGNILYKNIKGKNIEIINESYNANPISMINAIKNFDLLITKKEKIAIIGDMLELGSKSKLYHQEVARCLKSAEIKTVYLIGKEVRYIFSKLKNIENCYIYQNIQDFRQIFPEIVNEKSIYLVKGSNGVGLNQLLNENF